MSDSYGGGMPQNRDAIVQALMNVQNPPPSVASPVMPPPGPGIPVQGGVAGGNSTSSVSGGLPISQAGAMAPISSAVAPPPGGIGRPPYLPPLMPQGASASYGLPQAPPMGAPGPAFSPPVRPPIVPDLSQQLPPGGIPRY